MTLTLLIFTLSSWQINVFISSKNRHSNLICEQLGLISNKDKQHTGERCIPAWCACVRVLSPLHQTSCSRTASDTACSLPSWPVYDIFHSQITYHERSTDGAEVELKAIFYRCTRHPGNRVHTEHWKWFSVVFQHLFICVFQDFPGSFIMSIFSMTHNTEYVTQFIIILNNRSNRVWQWTTIMYVKAENMYMGQKCGNHLVYFPSLSRTLAGERRWRPQTITAKWLTATNNDGHNKCQWPPQRRLWRPHMSLTATR